jgi:hypothetical protein
LQTEAASEFQSLQQNPSPEKRKTMKNTANHKCLFSIAVAAASVISAQAAVTNLFANGGFEIAGTNPPAAEAWVPAASGYTRSNDARSGSFSASLASPELNAAVMLQNSVGSGMLPGITPGDNPLMSFWAKGFAGTTGNVLFSLRYLNGAGDILATSGNVFFQGSINPSTWTEITYDLGVVPVGASAAFIEFSQGIGPIDGVGLLAGTVLIDDVVLLGEAIPEPSSVALLGLGSVALLARRRRQA